MSIRPAETNDAPALQRLVTQLSHFYLHDEKADLPDWLAQSLTAEAFKQRIQNIDYFNYVYELDAELAGYVALKGSNHLYHLFVAEQYQGAGIARELWNHVLEQTGAEIVTVRSSLNAVPVYKRFGFTVSEPVTAKDGVGFQPMEWRLSAR